jgi:hypothetical protein
MSQSNEADSWLPEDLASIVTSADPIPFDVMDALRASFDRRSSDGDVAELVYDSVVDEPQNVRSTAAGRQLSFQGPQLSVEMEVVGASERVVGQFVPAVPGEVEVRYTSGSYVIGVDDYGHFVADAVPKGPVSFRCRGNAGSESFLTVTDWVVL